jgi:6-methylsalicylate decarboxylase
MHESTTPTEPVSPARVPTVTRRAQLAAGVGAGTALLLGRAAASRAETGTIRVDAHAHALPAFYSAALKSAGVRPPLGSEFPAWSEQSAASFMWRYGITAQVLSISDPGVEFLPVAGSVELARRLNDSLADLIRRRPHRFAALAVLPARDTAASLAEIRRALDVLELDGVGLLSNYGGEYLGAPRFRPLLEELDGRGAYVFVHPTIPRAKPVSSLPDPIVEFPFETTRTVDSLLRADLLRAYPNIRWQLSHAGGVIPGLVDQLGRDLAYDPSPLLARMRYDTALSSSPQAMAGVKATTPLANVMFATDWPFSSTTYLLFGTPQKELGDSFSGADLQAVLSGNILRELPRLAQAIGAAS